MAVSANASVNNNNILISIKPMANDCSVKLKDGQNLGRVQSVQVNAGVGEISSAVLHTICNEAEVEILQRDTELRIIINDREAYQRGQNSLNNQEINNDYEVNSYCWFMFEKGAGKL